MNEGMKKTLLLGAGAAAGGWGGAMIMARVGAAYGLRLGPAGTVAGAAVGALIGAGLCKVLVARMQEGEGALELDMQKEAA